MKVSFECQDLSPYMWMALSCGYTALLGIAVLLGETLLGGVGLCIAGAAGIAGLFPLFRKKYAYYAKINKSQAEESVSQVTKNLPVKLSSDAVRKIADCVLSEQKCVVKSICNINPETKEASTADKIVFVSVSAPIEGTFDGTLRKTFWTKYERSFDLYRQSADGVYTKLVPAES